MRSYRKAIVIKLSEIYEKNVTSRASISSIIEKYRLSSDLKITFDFSQINFLSRSAAQQLILERDYFVNKNIKFEFTNIEFQVNKMLELAESKLERKKIAVTHKQINSIDELECFLCSI